MHPVWRQQLLDDGWKLETIRFWDEVPCVYDLSVIKSVILIRTPVKLSVNEFEAEFYWKYGRQDLPSYVDTDHVVLRRYVLHHSMNALLWHDHGDRFIGDFKH